jgi:hypothetical protein
MDNKNLPLREIPNQLNDTYDRAIMPKKVSKLSIERRG